MKVVRAQWNALSPRDQNFCWFLAFMFVAALVVFSLFV